MNCDILNWPNVIGLHTINQIKPEGDIGCRYQIALSKESSCPIILAKMLNSQ